jgi:hypothetical protein
MGLTPFLFLCETRVRLFQKSPLLLVRILRLNEGKFLSSSGSHGQGFFEWTRY